MGKSEQPKWLTVEEAWQRLEQAVPAFEPGQQTLPIHQAVDFTLAETLASPINLPPADNSAMDGLPFASTMYSPAVHCPSASASRPVLQ